MSINHTSLSLNGETYSPDQLIEVCRSTLSGTSPNDWEKSFFNFVLQWLNQEQHFIEVKTSGSTGNPKTIRLDKNKMVASANMTLNHLSIQKGENALLCLSCDYIAGKMMVVRAFTGGLNLITVAPSNNPLEGLPENQRIDFTAWVPLQLQGALEHSPDHRIQRIKNMLIGGAPVNHTLREKIKDFPNNIYETYGMTETVSHIALKKLTGKEDEYFATLDNITVRKDERGCLVITAPGYSSAPIITNDLVEIKDEKHFKWLGRYDHVVNSGGIKIIPEMLEKKVEHLFENRFFFAGLPDEKLGQQLVLVVEGMNIPDVASELKNILGKYEMPKEIKFIKRFVETATGKIDRKGTLMM